MSALKTSLNNSALRLVSKLVKEAELCSVSIEKPKSGATLIDAGLKAEGGFLAGETIIEICLGGYGTAKVFPMQYESLIFPSVFVYTDNPTISTLASQLDGWHIKLGTFAAVASGPARALALEPLSLFEKIGYKEESNVAVLVLRTETKPSEDLIQHLANKCKVEANNLYIIHFSSMSIAGVMQSSARTIEAGLFNLMTFGLNPWLVKHAWGCAPIGLVPSTPEEGMTRENVAVACGGTANYMVSYDNDEQLGKWVAMVPVSSSKMVQEARELSARNPHYSDIIKDIGVDLDTLDNKTLSPAIVAVANLKTGKNFRAGTLDMDALKSYFRI